MRHRNAFVVRLITALMLSVSLLTPLAVSPQVAFAAPGVGDVSVNFVAANPLLYDKSTGSNATTTSFVNSLAGKDFRCGDRVVFFNIVTVGGSGTGSSTLTLTNTFAADTALGYTNIVAELAPNDPADTSTGGEVLTSTSNTAAGVTTTTVEITGVDHGEVIVVKYTATLDGAACEYGYAGPKVTGNLDARYAGAEVNDVPKPGGGAQTVPLLGAADVVEPGFIIIDKVTDPAGSTQSFEFNPSWMDTNFFLTDTDAPYQTGAIAPGIYTIDELAVANWTTAVTCVDPTNNSTVGGESTATIDVVAGETVRCTFTNTQARGSITIVKDAVPNDAQDFAFRGTLGNFNLDDDADPTLSNSQVFSNLLAGTYTVTEEAVAGWDLTGIVCDDGSGTDLATRTASITLGAGENVICTFTNTKQDPRLTLAKTATPSTYSAVGEVISYEYLLTNTGNVTLGGPFTVTDDKVTVSCPADITSLEPDASITCTATYIITQADLDTGFVTNTAMGHGFFGTTPVDSNEDSETVTAVAAAAIDVEKYVSVDGGATWVDADAAPGPYLESDVAPQFKFVVTNTGNVTLGSISLTDSDFDLSSCTIPGTLAPTASFECTITGTWAAGQHTNTATASGSHGATTANDTDAANYFGAAPAIDIQKTPDSQTVIYGQTATFTILVTNTGNVDLTDVAVSDLLAPDCAATIGNLAAGASDTYTCTLENVTTSFTNVATVNGSYGTTPVTDSDTAAVIVDILPDISVTKTASPTSVAETGGDVEFTFAVTNNSSEPFILNSLTDDKFGDLDGQGTCAVPQTIAAGGTYTCVVTQWLSSDSLTAHTNAVTAAGVDEQGNPDSAFDDATVTFTDVAPDISVTKTADPTHVPETGGNVTFTFVVTNDGVEDVTLTSLTDSVFGNLNGQGDCVTGGLILVGGSYTCAVTKSLSSDSLTAHTNTVRAVATDDDGTTDTDTDDATVTFDDVAPVIDVTKTANPTSVPETGGSVTFTFRITNVGEEEVTVTSILDDRFGNLLATAESQNGDADIVLAPDAWYEFTYTTTLSSDTLAAHTNRVDVIAVDDDGTTTTDYATATVTFIDVLPAVTVTKTASSSTVPETGGSLTFTYVVTNTSTEAVEITALTDDKFGTLDGDADCEVGTVLAAGASCSFTATFAIPTGNAGETHVNVFTATVSDDDGNTAWDDDDETVTYTDVKPDIAITKTANPTAVPETGANVAFTIVVTNNSLEDATIDSLVDSDFELAAHCPAAVGTVLAYGESYTCVFTELIAGDFAGDDHINTATVVASDGDGNTDDASDDATVTFTDVLPTVDLTKTVTPATLAEPGGVFTYTLTIENTSDEDVTITTLTDNNALSQQCLDLINDLLTPGQVVTCTYSVTQTDAGTYPNTASVTVADDEGNPASDTDTASVAVTDVTPTITVEKTASPTSVPETGANVTFTFTVTNTSVEPVTITSLEDDVYGTLDGDADCEVDTVLAVGASCTFTITRMVAGDFGGPDHVNTFTAVAEDNEGNEARDDDNATVTFTDVLPAITVTKTASSSTVPETGGSLTFTYVVTNNSSESASITALTDDKFGTLAGDADCQVGTVLAAGANCSFTALFAIPAGDYPGSHVNVFTATVSDDDGNTAWDDDDETVTYTDVLPDISVTKTANPPAVMFTGGDVTFTFVVTNNGLEAATITSLTDDVFDVLAGDADCQVGTILAAGASCSFAITRWIEGEPDGSHTNVFTVVATDDDGNEDTASDDATVRFQWNGRTPGYWKNHTNKKGGWPTFTVNDTVNVVPKTYVTDVFDVPASLLTNGMLDLNKNRKPDTLLDALNYKGGSDLAGKAQILLRAATAGLLNEAYFGDNYPPYDSVEEFIAAVNAVLATEDPAAYTSFAAQLDYWNNGIH